MTLLKSHSAVQVGWGGESDSDDRKKPFLLLCYRSVRVFWPVEPLPPLNAGLEDPPTLISRRDDGNFLLHFYLIISLKRSPPHQNAI